MTDDKDKTPIEKAWALAEDPQKIKGYYKAWSDTYDADVANEDYHSPPLMVKLLTEQLDLLWPEVDRKIIRILDAGCGTGLVGEYLADAGYDNLVGFDLSVEMIEKAALKGRYTYLSSGVDLNQPLFAQINQHEFDVVVCVGVLTLGHVPPTGVYQLLEVAHPGGIVALSAREAYVDDYDFEAILKQLEVDGLVRILFQEYGPLVGDALGLYVIMQKL